MMDRESHVRLLLGEWGFRHIMESPVYDPIHVYAHGESRLGPRQMFWMLHDDYGLAVIDIFCGRLNGDVTLYTAWKASEEEAREFREWADKARANPNDHTRREWSLVMDGHASGSYGEGDCFCGNLKFSSGCTRGWVDAISFNLSQMRKRGVFEINPFPKPIAWTAFSFPDTEITTVDNREPWSFCPKTSMLDFAKSWVRATERMASLPDDMLERFGYSPAVFAEECSKARAKLEYEMARQ